MVLAIADDMDASGSMEASGSTRASASGTVHESALQLAGMQETNEKVKKSQYKVRKGHYDEMK